MVASLGEDGSHRVPGIAEEGGEERLGRLWPAVVGTLILTFSLVLQWLDVGGAIGVRYEE